MACKSMTGFGQALVEDTVASVRVELRTVNHRFVEWNLRLPREFMPFEPELRALLATEVVRGRGDGFLTVERIGSSSTEAVVDWSLLDTMNDTLHAMEKRYGMDVDYAAAMVQSLHMPDVVRVERASLQMEALQDIAMRAFSLALDALMASRQSEGERIVSDMRHKLDALRQMVETMRQVAPEVVEVQRDRLSRRLQELAGDVDESRILTEIAILLDRFAIDEEVVRFDSHLEAFEDALRSSGAVGRRLDFLIQEMNREINTIGSKSNHLPISRLVVDAKVVIEQLREQAQNLE